jgi:hypothetical protein
LSQDPLNGTLREALDDKGLYLSSRASPKKKDSTTWEILDKGYEYRLRKVASNRIFVYNTTDMTNETITGNESYIDSYNSKLYNVSIKFFPQEHSLSFPVIEDFTARTEFTNAMWLGFYEKYITKNLEEGEISDAFKVGLKIIPMLQAIIKNITTQLTDENGILARAARENGFIDGVSPNDTVSFLQQVYSAVGKTIEEVSAYYTEVGGDGREFIEEQIKETFGDFANMNTIFSALQQFIRENFEKICRLDGTYRYSFNRNPIVEAGRDLAGKIVENRDSITFSINTSYKEVLVTNNHYIFNYPDRKPRVVQYDKEVFDLNVENPSNFQIEEAAYKKISNVQSVDQSTYRGSNSHIENVFLAVRDYVEKGFRQIKDHELNKTGGIISQLELAKYDKDNKVQLESGIKSFGLVIFEIITDPDGGIIGGVADFVDHTVYQMIVGSDFANTKYITPILKDEPFEFFQGSYDAAKKNNNVDDEVVNLFQEPDFLPLRQTELIYAEDLSEYYKFIHRNQGLDGNHLLVDFYHPDNLLSGSDKKESSSNYVVSDIKGTYYNDPTEYKIPYQSDWNIRLFGEIDINTTMEDFGLVVNGTTPATWVNSTLTINLTVTVSVVTGWSLKGVNYEMQLDLLNLIIKLLSAAWDGLKEVLGPTLDSLQDLIDLISNFVTKIMGYANEVIEWVNNQVQNLIAQIQKILGDSVLSTIENILKALKFEKIEFTMFGIDLTIEYNIKFPTERSRQDRSVPMFSVRIQKDLDLDFTLSVATAPGSTYGMGVSLVGSFEILGMDFDVIVDPFMVFYNHMFILNGRLLNETGDGLGVEILIPDCVSYKKLEYEMVVGPPTGIPIPILGIVVFPTIGVNLKYAFPTADNLIVNEFDYDQMEIYNPTNYMIDLNGWVVENRNEPKKSFTVDRSVEVPAGGFTTIAYDKFYQRPKNVSLLELGKKTLENKSITDVSNYMVDKLDGVDNSFLGTGKGRLSAGEGLKLREPDREDGTDGDIVDTTPIRRKPNQKNYFNITLHNKTKQSWQRKYDAGFEWEKNKPTWGRRNSNVTPELDVKSLILNALMDSFTEAYVEHQIQQKIKAGNVTLEEVTECLKSTINKFVEKILELIRHVVMEVEFFLDLGVAPIGTMNPSGGYRLSFVIDGEGIALLLEWLVKVLGVFVNQLLYGDTGGGYPPLPGDLPEHMYIRFSGYFGLDALPESIKNMMAQRGMNTSDMIMNIMIQVNLATLGCLFGKDWGKWQIDFGIFISGSTGPIVRALYSNPPKNDPDFWLIKGRVYQIKNGTY